VFGTVGPTDNFGPPVSLYSLDNLSDVTFAAPNTSIALYSQPFYQSPPLQNGRHTLVITFKSSGSSFFLDYISFQLPPTSSTATATSTTSTTGPSGPNYSATSVNDVPPSIKSTPISSTASATSTTATTATTAPSGPNSSVTSANDVAPSTKSTPVGAMVGGPIGSVLLLLVAAVLFFLYRRRKSRYALSDKHSVLSPGSLLLVIKMIAVTHFAC
jgi:hypothetical protein